MQKYRIVIGDTILASDGNDNLLEIIRKAKIPLDAPCGGNGTCGQCKVVVTGSCRDASGKRRDFHGEKLLACRWYPDGDIELELDGTGSERVLRDITSIPLGEEGYGLAVDIGTTTLAVYLYDLKSGECLGSKGAANSQRSYGADVISRIQNASRPGGLEEMTAIIRRQIMELAGKLTPDTKRITRVSVAGNTVMEHIFMGLSPESIGVAPFKPLSLFGEEVSAAGLLDGLAEDCMIYICPAVAGYVGGDITAGLLGSGAYRSPGTLLYIDVGTNGEMALGGRDGFLCCAAAAGPAFEGASISCGSPARDGAISRVDEELSFSVIGGGPPLSICGSGLIDAVAALIKNGIIDHTGYMDKPYYFCDSVYISPGDVRELQLAKAAICAGIETLFSLKGISCEAVDEVLLAGGFGTYMDKKSACAIGLFPPVLLEKIRFVGNCAGRGAALALSDEVRQELLGIRALLSYEELSTSRIFGDIYMNSMMFV